MLERSDSSSNRTFMELKYAQVKKGEVYSHCSNRTFMELKYAIIKDNSEALQF